MSFSSDISDMSAVSGGVAPYIGRARIHPAGPVDAGSFGTWEVVYEVGEAGIDDGGRLRLCFRINSDWGVPQTTDPAAPNYVTATTSGNARLTLAYNTRGHVRPWSKALTVLVDNGYLAAGDFVTIVLGDTAGGGPGFETQPYVERNARFAVFVDAGGTGAYLPVPLDGGIDLVGGPAHSVEFVLPSDIVVGEPFRLGVAVRDIWGNPASGVHVIALDGPGIEGLLPTVEVGAQVPGAATVNGVVARRPGILRIAGTIEGTTIACSSNPAALHTAAPSTRRWWGDLHGQSSETCGTGPAETYLGYARDNAFLDFAGHQGNDFELTDANWACLKDTLNTFNADHRFITFIGYEWSGNTAGGGDNNVMFRGNDAPIHRSALWLLSPAEARDAVCPTIAALRTAFCGRDDVMLIPHVGGRFANVDDIDDALSPLVEIWSTHGEFEWLFEDAVSRGHRVGITAGSDDHTGRLGATRPGRRAFAVRGGLLCLRSGSLTRDDLWTAIRSRHAYGTTGERILLSVTAEGAMIGEDLTSDRMPRFDIEVHGTLPIEQVELRRGLGELLAVHRSAEEIPGAIRVSWRGARNRGREREARWDGMLEIEGPMIKDATTFSFDRRSEGIEWLGDRHVTWRSTTAGDTDGVNLLLSDSRSGTIRIDTPFIEVIVDLAGLGSEPVAYPCGGLGLELTVERLRAPLGLDVVCSLAPPPTDATLTPYVIVVRQVDGSKAWSSPIWVSQP